MFRIRVLVIAVACALLAACSNPHRNSSAEDIAALKQVVELFRVSIIKKDKPTFTKLFFSNNPGLITWQPVLDDPSHQWVQKAQPQALKAEYRPDNNYITFIDSIVDSKLSQEETFSNVEIDTDGEIASISFDYTYLIDNRLNNHGREMWLLVRTEQGWKITSVLFSVRLPQANGGQ